MFLEGNWDVQRAANGGVWWYLTHDTRRFTFLWTASEWAAFVTGERRVFHDACTLCMASYCDLVELLQLPDMNGTLGSGTMHYARFVVPFAVRPLIDAMVQALPVGERIELPRSVREAWLRLHGRGQGTVEVGYGPDAEAAVLAATAQSERCGELLRHWENIARNTTFGPEVARLRIVLERSTTPRVMFLVWAYSPSGTCIMHGGIVNHGTDEAPDWASHI